MIRIIQSNLNRSRPALDMLLQYIREEDVALCVVSEVPRIRNPSSQWVLSTDELAGIYHRPEITRRLMTSGTCFPGIAVADIGTITVISCYLSPNMDRSDTLEFFDNLSDAMDMVTKPAIVAGDWNAKSPMWGSTSSNWRGRLLENWISERDLCILNTGSTPTCVRPQGSSTIDVTLCTSGMFSYIHSWNVLTDTVSLSDHYYISYETHIAGTHNGTDDNDDVYSVNSVNSVNSVYNSNSNSNVNTTRKRGTRRKMTRRVNACIKGWSWKTLNEEEFCSILVWHTPEISNMLTNGTTDPNQISQILMQTLEEAADFAAKRKKGYNKNRSMYWWNLDIASIRKDVLIARRRWTRYNSKRNNGNFCEEELLRLQEEYKKLKINLRNNIAEAKSNAWNSLLTLIDEDPWGLPFKIVMGKLRKSTPSLTELIDDADRKEILDKLFPVGTVHDPDILWHNYRWHEQWEVTYAEVDREIRRKPSKGAAPGLDGIPDKIMKLFPNGFVNLLTMIYNRCISTGIFPSEWKKGRLVLIPKQDGVMQNGTPKSRPICVLDEISKAFERLLCKKINQWFFENPQYALSENQYGFIEGRSTVDALRRVVNTIEDAFSNELVVVAISIDIQNAFNSIPWKTIRMALKEKKIPDYVRRLIDSYLHNRIIIYPIIDGVEARQVLAGVPQGSVLGPLLWNVGFDSVLKRTLEDHTRITCYADDTLLLTSAKDVSTALSRASLQVHRILNHITRLGLKVATDKTKVTLFTKGYYRITDNTFTIEKDIVKIEKSFKYLGVMLDQRLTFLPHFYYTMDKTARVAGALTGLMPNLRGPSEPKRKLYGNVVLSVLLYAAPIWSTYLHRNIKMINKINQSMKPVVCRISCSYRTVSLEAASLLARIPPVSLLAECRRRIYERTSDLRRYDEYTTENIKEIKIEENLLLYRQWLIKLEKAKYGIRTIQAILPSFKEWIDRKHGRLEFHLTQAFSGHGCFGYYLDRIQKADSPYCLACNHNVIDTAEHTVEHCSRWLVERDTLTRIIGQDLRLETIIKKILEDKEKWAAFATFCRKVILTKENEERARQARRSRSRSLTVRTSVDST